MQVIMMQKKTTGKQGGVTQLAQISTKPSASKMRDTGTEAFVWLVTASNQCQITDGRQVSAAPIATTSADY